MAQSYTLPSMSTIKIRLFHIVLVMLTFCALSASAKSQENYKCPISSCGNIKNISYPFRLKDDHNNCGDQNYELSCENNRTVLYLSSKRFYVEAITYYNFSIRLTDPGIMKGNCSSFPIHSLSYNDIPEIFYTPGWPRFNPVIFIECLAPVNSSIYSDTACHGRKYSFSDHLKHHSYVVFPDFVSPMTASDVEVSCSIRAISWVSSYFFERQKKTTFVDFHDALAYGFELLWHLDDYRDGYMDGYGSGVEYFDEDCDVFTASYIRRLFQKNISLSHTLHCIFGEELPDFWEVNHRLLNKLIGLFFGTRFFFGILLLMLLVAYKLRGLHLSIYDNIEDFLQTHNKLMPIRYSYSEIKKMTSGFRHRLGEGGYGTVFKGKLRSGPLVAVKLLGKSKATGEEFINEVATIGRIHHVNVVRLVGFCVQGSKRALIYDYMPNGSLEKYIFPTEENLVSLDCAKMFEISLGIARGIEYLHRGCDMQILHFDIKPHNILLDENLVPKVSDFGLAKLYSTDDSIVSLTAARGTMGYMAPELFYKNIGGVSYKADVYSFGMLLMEMAGRRKNLNLLVDHSSQIYFPSWAYDQYNEGKEIEIEATSEEEKKMTKKMIMVALWCIQLKPIDRPSMSKVVEMLEGDVELLQMPPKPFLSPQEPPPNEDQAGVAMHTTPPTIAQSDFVNSFSFEIEEN